MVVWAGIVAATRTASIASIVMALLLVPGIILFDHREWSIVWTVGIAVLVLWRHTPNIKRLLGGAEHSVGGESE